MCGRSECWSREISVPYIQVWIWHLLGMEALLYPSCIRSRMKRSSRRQFCHGPLKGPRPSAVCRIRMETEGKWGILEWCILITVFYLTDGIEYNEPSVGYGVASGSDQGRANWIDPSTGLQKHRSVWINPYMNGKDTFSELNTGETKCFGLLSLMINVESTRCFKSWRAALSFGGNSYTSPYFLHHCITSSEVRKITFFYLELLLWDILDLQRSWNVQCECTESWVSWIL